MARFSNNTLENQILARPRTIAIVGPFFRLDSLIGPSFLHFRSELLNSEMEQRSKLYSVKIFKKGNYNSRN